MERRNARELAFQLIFEYEFDRCCDHQQQLELAAKCREEEYDKYINNVYFGVISKISEIDEIIEKYSVGWKTKRMSKVSLAIMRLSIYEMQYLADVPYSVAINEAVELAKKYDHDKAPAFINGILNSAADALGLKPRKAEASAEPDGSGD